MSIIDWVLLLALGSFGLTFLVTTIIGVIKAKKDKKNNKKEKNVNGCDSN